MVQLGSNSLLQPRNASSSCTRTIHRKAFRPSWVTREFLPKAISGGEQVPMQAMLQCTPTAVNNATHGLAPQYRRTAIGSMSTPQMSRISSVLPTLKKSLSYSTTSTGRDITMANPSQAHHLRMQSSASS